jgi:pimeloyl-ACP methyl ester carboxylesterase
LGTGRDSIRAYGEWLLAYLASISVDRAVLVGHSMGGAIAMDVALRCPARVSGLGLVATGARLPVAPAILNGLKEDSEAAVGLICQWAFGPEAPEAIIRLGQRQMLAADPEVLYRNFVACDTFDVLDQLPKISVPTLILSGTHDTMTPSKYAVQLRDRIGGAELHLIEGAGHMLMIEKPAAVSKALTAFLSRL